MSRGSSRKRLLETTARLLREQGYAGTTLVQILEASKTRRSSLYYLFPEGKAELAAAAVREHRSQLSQGLFQLQARYRNAREGIPALFHFFERELQESDYHRGSALAHMAVGVAEDLVLLEVRRGYQHLKDIFRVWMSRAGLSESAAAERAALALMLLEGSIVLCQAYRSCEPLRQALRQLEELTPVSSSSQPESESP